MTSQPFDVAVVGDNTLDRYLDEPEIGDLIGGNALNVAAQLAMAGLKLPVTSVPSVTTMTPH